MAKWQPIAFTPEQQAAFTQRQEALFAELPQWSLDRDNSDAPKVGDIEGMGEALQKGYSGLIAAFREYDTKQNLPEMYRTEQYKEWARPAAEMLASVRELRDDNNARNVAASVIGRAVQDYNQISGRGVAVDHTHVRNMMRSVSSQSSQAGIA